MSAAIIPDVGEQLISPETFSDIQEIAGLLPGAITDRFGFECKLGVDQPKADFLVCCRTRQGAPEILAGQKPDWDLPFSLQGQPVWRRIRTFSQNWNNPESPLCQGVHNMWLEFDVDGKPSPTPVPNVFIGSNRLWPMTPVADLHTIPSKCAWLTDLALPMLMGNKVSLTVRRQLARCINLLPGDARLFQVGLMLARASESVRLCVRGISRTQIVSYLKALAWEGPHNELETLIDSLEENVERIDLDFNADDRLLSTIGLECYISAERLPRFLAHLVSSKLCTAPKAKALGLWPGSVHQHMRPNVWPKDLLAASGLRGSGFQSTFVRFVHHVKLVYEPKAPLQAKAYIGIHHRWRSL
jgi:hypothetical protein